MLKEISTALFVSCVALGFGCHNKPAPRVAPPAPDFHAPPMAQSVGVEEPASEGDRRLMPVDAVYFDFASDRLTPHGKDVLASVADWLAITPGAKLIIEGYTDRTGPRSYNLWLSHKRADAVARYLESQGVAIDRMEVYAMGERTSPAADRSADRQVRVYAQSPASRETTSG